MGYPYQPDWWYKYFWFIKIDATNLADPTIAATVPTLIFMDIIIIILSIFTFYHSYKTYGLWKSALFLIGSFFYTGLEEITWMTIGYFVPTFRTYQFNYYKAGFMWFLCIPVATCLGWYFIAYGCYYIAEKIFVKWQNSNWGLIKTAAVAGLLAMNIDLMVDPFAVRNEQWYWLAAQNETIWILGIPYTNFVGWFLLIFIFAIFWQKVTDSRDKYGTVKSTIIFAVGLIGILLLTILIIFVVAVVFSPFNGTIIGFL
ncbi:MAG: carotenoid biosynthesis protein [Candidatus Helarchaeota archaeon]